MNYKYVLIMTSHDETLDFTQLQNKIALNNAKDYYNQRSPKSKQNPKKIDDLVILSSRKIAVELSSAKPLSLGREAQALWLFSHELAENQGFEVYITSGGKLLKSA